jgi:hypothetical protein
MQFMKGIAQLARVSSLSNSVALQSTHFTLRPKMFQTHLKHPETRWRNNGSMCIVFHFFLLMYTNARILTLCIALGGEELSFLRKFQ